MRGLARLREVRAAREPPEPGSAPPDQAAPRAPSSSVPPKSW